MRIGVFDSGVGGFTVLNALAARFPTARFFYYGDTAHLPYGTKSAAQIQRLSVNCANRIKRHQLDVLVVACNTASSWAIEEIQEAMGDTPVIGVVEPGVTTVLEKLATRSIQTILVLATRATIRSSAYGTRLNQHLAGSDKIVLEQACPLWVPMIEEGWVDHPILRETIREYTRAYLDSYEPGVVLLGCTHYPWIREIIASEMPGWEVLDSAQAVTKELVRRFPEWIEAGGGSKPLVTCEFSDPLALPAFAVSWIQEHWEEEHVLEEQS